MSVGLARLLTVKAGVSEDGSCEKQDEFDAVPLGAEEFHHETGRLNTSRLPQRSNKTKQQQKKKNLKTYSASVIFPLYLRYKTPAQ